MEESARRYLPQIRIDEIGEEGQRRLTGSRVLVVGAGALGSVAAMYLAGAGVGNIIIADFDTVDITNLHRQVFYKEKDTGKSKVTLLAEEISALNSDIKVIALREIITRKKLREMAGEIDLIMDAADNPDTTYMIDTFCRENGLPWVTAGVKGWEAQIFSCRPGGVGYSEIVPKEGLGGEILPCSLEGILGATAGMAACIMTAEAVKILLGIESESGLLTVNLLTDSFNFFRI